VYTIDYLCVLLVWEMALSIGLDVSFDKFQDWELIRKKAYASIKNGETAEFSMAVTLVITDYRNVFASYIL
jgi:hypothetical protein